MTHLLVDACLVILSLAAVSCSSMSLRSTNPVNTSGGIATSSICGGDPRPDIDWDGESLPIRGDARELFSDLGPDYFGSLLRNLPEVPENH